MKNINEKKIDSIAASISAMALVLTICAVILMVCYKVFIK